MARAAGSGRRKGWEMVYLHRIVDKTEEPDGVQPKRVSIGTRRVA
jgi:hypothetical protein